MNNKQLGKLLVCDIVEPNDKELQEFKTNFLRKKQNSYVARKAREHIKLLEQHIIALYTRIEHIDKLTKEEYIAFCNELQEKGGKLSSRIKELERALESRNQKIFNLNEKIRKQDDILERYRASKIKLNGE
jgi:hypothetical protein